MKDLQRLGVLMLQSKGRGRVEMLRITTEKKKAKTVLSVEGRLAGPFVPTLEQCWRELKTAFPQEKFYVDLCGVSFIDGAGKMLLKEMHRQGGQLVAQGCLNQAIVREIIGSEKSAVKSDDGKENKGGPIIFYIMLLGLLFGAAGAHGQDNSTAASPTQVAGEPL